MIGASRNLHSGKFHLCSFKPMISKTAWAATIAMLMYASQASAGIITFDIPGGGAMLATSELGIGAVLRLRQVYAFGGSLSGNPELIDGPNAFFVETQGDPLGTVSMRASARSNGSAGLGVSASVTAIGSIAGQSAAGAFAGEVLVLDMRGSDIEGFGVGGTSITAVGHWVLHGTVDAFAGIGGNLNEFDNAEATIIRKFEDVQSGAYSEWNDAAQAGLGNDSIGSGLFSHFFDEQLRIDPYWLDSNGFLVGFPSGASDSRADFGVIAWNESLETLAFAAGNAGATADYFNSSILTGLTFTDGSTFEEHGIVAYSPVTQASPVPEPASVLIWMMSGVVLLFTAISKPCPLFLFRMHDET